MRTENAGLDPAGVDPDQLGATRARGQDHATSAEQPTTDGLVWLVNVGGEQTVEMCHADIEDAWRAGRIDASTLVWRETMADWTPLGAVPLLSMGLPAQRQSAGDSRTEPSDPPALRPSPRSADPHSSDFAAAKRRRRNSMSGVPSSKSARKLASATPAPHTPSPTQDSAAPSSPNATPKSPEPAPGSPSATPISANASLTQLTMQAIAMVDPHSDDVGRPSSPWALKSARPETPAQSAPSTTAAPAMAAPDTATLGDATFEKEFEELWAGGLDPNPAERAAPGATVASDPNFEADFAELWAQGPQPTSLATGDEQQAVAAGNQAEHSPAEGAAESPVDEQVVRAAAQPEARLEPAGRLEPAAPAQSDESSRVRGGDQPAPMSRPAAVGALRGEPSLRAAAAAHRLHSDDLQSSGEREAPIQPSEPKPKSGPSIESLRDMRPVPPRERSRLTPVPMPSHPSSPETSAGLGQPAALESGSARTQAVAGPAADEHARPDIQPSGRPPPPRSPAARLGAALAHDASLPDKGEPRGSSLPSPSRPSVPSDAPLSPSAPSQALGSSPSHPSGLRPAAAAAGDARPIAIFERPSATLVFGGPQPAASVKAGPPPLPASSSAATASPAPVSVPPPLPAPSSAATASPAPVSVPPPLPAPSSVTTSGPAPALAPLPSASTPGVAPSPPVSPVSSGFSEADFVAALKGGKRWSVRALATGAGEPWASLRGTSRLSRRAVIGAAAGAVVILALVLSLTQSSNDPTESASAQEPPGPDEAKAPASPHAPSATTVVTSETDHGSNEAAAQSALSRAMKKALTGASKRRRDTVATADSKPSNDQNLRRDLDKTLQDWSSGTALPRDKVAPPKTTKAPRTVARRPQSRPIRSSSNIPPPSFSSSEGAPKKTAWDPTNPGF
ncbi:MAG: DUF4339 domain-containing protein [Polyangiaceae bacterium]|nr:DUF4339 domain-containing protein [Polyangiaceae bacterium]